MQDDEFVEVCAEDANNYCEIISLLGMEEEGNPLERIAALIAIEQSHERLKALVNSPHLEQFLRAVHLEAVHQIERWGTVSDRGKDDADWFWLVGYLAGKALNSAKSADKEKALHHCISTAAALYNWHSALKGVDVRMCPGRSDIEEFLEPSFPGATQMSLFA